MLARIASMTSSGVQVVALLALSDDGAPVYDKDNAAVLAELGVPAFACTPDAFPDLLALAITGGDIAAWEGYCDIWCNLSHHPCNASPVRTPTVAVSMDHQPTAVTAHRV